MPIHFESVSDLARSFGRVPAETRARMVPKLMQGGQLIQQRAQEHASWSSRIPGAISVKASISASGGVVVAVDTTAAPHARPYEGRSSGGRGGFFRHPLFGDREHWYDQATRPFLRPARDESVDEVMGLIREAIQEATADLI